MKCLPYKYTYSLNGRNVSQIADKTNFRHPSFNLSNSPYSSAQAAEKKYECTEICVFVRIEKNLSAKRNEVNDYYHNSINAIEMCVHACIYGIDVNVYFVT